MGLYSPPAAINYPSPVISQPTLWWNEMPPEGPRMIPIAILWAVMGGPAFCVNVNLDIAQANGISQVAALNVDNTRCGSDVVFWFPDTQSTITIPAYEEATVPVFSNARNFTVNAIGVLSASGQDVTAFEILNTMPPPVSLPTSQAQQVAAGAAVNLAANHTGGTKLTVLPSTISGTIQALVVTLDGMTGAAAPFDLFIAVVDGAGSTIWAGVPTWQTAAVEVHQNLVQLSGLNVRFKDGLYMTAVMTSGFAPLLFMSAFALYRTP